MTLLFCSFALVIGCAIGRTYSLKQVRNAEAEALRFVRAKQIFIVPERSGPERSAGMTP